MLKNKDKIRTALKFVKYLDSLPASSAGKSEKVRKIQMLLLLLMYQFLSYRIKIDTTPSNLKPQKN